jgi:hypothetical protein
VRTLNEQPTRCKTYPIAHPVTKKRQRKEHRCVRKKEDSAIEKTQADRRKTEDDTHIDMLRQQLRVAELAKIMKQAKKINCPHKKQYPSCDITADVAITLTSTIAMHV